MCNSITLSRHVMIAHSWSVTFSGRLSSCTAPPSLLRQNCGGTRSMPDGIVWDTGRAPAIALLQDAMPRPGLPLVHFNDTCCGSVAELRSIILKARRLAADHAEQERAAAAVKIWLLAQIDKKRPAPPTDPMETAPDQPFAPERLAA